MKMPRWWPWVTRKRYDELKARYDEACREIEDEQGGLVSEQEVRQVADALAEEALGELNLRTIAAEGEIA